jgi:hypothetical protein
MLPSYAWPLKCNGVSCSPYRREHIKSGPVEKLCQPSGPGEQGSVQRHGDPGGGVAARSKRQRDRDVIANPHTPAVDDDDHRTSAAAGLGPSYPRASLTPAPLIGQSCCGGLAPASVASAPITTCATTTSRPHRCRGARPGPGGGDRCDLALMTGQNVVARTSTGSPVSAIVLPGRKFEEKQACRSTCAQSVTYAIDALINQPTALLTSWPLAPSSQLRTRL